MPTSLSRQAHLEELRQHGGLLADRAREAGLDAAVPTCSDWTVAHLVAHQAMVHRWAAAKITCDEAFRFRDDDEIRRTEPDLLGYYVEGHGALVEALVTAPTDLEAPVFLDDAPAPREFWARRQAHETTIHAVDALAAQLGRRPTADETGISSELALDGIDELVSGFLPRNASKLYEGEGYVINVCPNDTDQAWAITVGPELATSEGRVDSSAAAFIGSSAQLYLGLWNRGDEIEVDGDAEVLSRWRRSERIAWG